MSAPAAVLAAIAKISPIVCDARCGLAAVTYDEEFDRPAISHDFADCPYVADPFSPAAVALALSVDRELARYVQLAHYGEGLPVHVWAAS